MTHIDNIPHILQYGITHRNSQYANPNYIPIGDSSLIGNRNSKEVFVTNGLDDILESFKIGDFIPFYFGLRTPMLYVIQNGFNGVTKQSPQNIIYCVTSVQKIIECNYLYYFTDGHPNKNEYTKIYNSQKINEIETIVDFEATNFKYWKSDTDLDLKRKKEAEFLVKQDISNQTILGYICYNEVTANKLLRLGILENKVVIRPNYFF